MGLLMKLPLLRGSLSLDNWFLNLNNLNKKMKTTNLKGLMGMKNKIFSEATLSGSFLDIIITQPVNGDAMINAIKVDLPSVASECRSLIELPQYESFAVLRVIFPLLMIKPMLMIDKEGESGESKQLVCLCDLPLHFQTIIQSIGRDKGFM